MHTVRSHRYIDAASRARHAGAPRRPRATRLTLLTLLFCCFGLFGCGGEDFSPIFRINKLRVMGIRSTPPSLRTGDNAQIEALVYSPNGPESINYTWSWCPLRRQADDFYACPVTREELIAILKKAAQAFEVTIPEQAFALLPAFELGNQPTATLQNLFPPEFAALFCNALILGVVQERPDLLGNIITTECDRGFPIELGLTVEDGDATLISKKRIEIHTGAPFPDTNPLPIRMEIRPELEDDLQRLSQDLDWIDLSKDLDDMWVEMTIDDPPPIIAGFRYEVRMVIDPESVDTWQPPAPDGSEFEFLEEQDEEMEWRYFTTAGDIGQESDYEPGFNTIEEAAIIPFVFRFTEGNDIDQDGVPNDRDNCQAVPNPDQNEDACTVRVWSVIEDERYGQAWMEGRVRIVGAVVINEETGVNVEVNP